MNASASRRSWLSQALHNKIIALVLAMIVAVPLFAAPADYSLTGLAALTLEGFALVLMTAILWRSRWDLRPENVKTFFRTGANLPILLFVGWVALSAALSPHKVFSLQQLLQVGAGALLYFAVGYQFRQSKHLSMLADVLLFLAFVVALGGMANYQMGLGLNGRARAIFGDPQSLGSFVMLLLPVVVALALGDKNPRRQTVAQIVSILMVGSLLLTQGRSAWMGGVAGLLVLGLLSMRVRERREKTSLPLAARKHQFVLPVLLATIALVFVVAMNAQNGDVAGRAASLSHLSIDNSWQFRLQTHWSGAVEMIRERPLTGWGAGLFPVYQSRFTNFGASIPAGGVGTRASLAEQAHNLYLQTAAELGLTGLVLLLCVLACFWITAWKRIGQMDAGIRRTLLIASLASTAGFAVDAMSSPSWQYAQMSMFFWLVLGMGTSCLRPRVRNEEEAPSPVVARRIGLVTRPLAVAASLCLATLLPTSYSAAQVFDYGGTEDPTNTPIDPRKKPEILGPVPGPIPGPGPVINPIPSPNDGGSGSSVAFGTAALLGVGYFLFGRDDDDKQPFIISPAGSSSASSN